MLKLNAAKSNDHQLVFDFVSKSGKDGSYINGVTIHFADDGRVRESWSSSGEEGKMDLYLNTRGEP